MSIYASGTGDIFASVLFGSLINGESMQNAIKKAANFVLESIKITLKDDNRTRYGVQFEKLLRNFQHFMAGGDLNLCHYNPSK